MITRSKRKLCTTLLEDIALLLLLPTSAVVAREFSVTAACAYEVREAKGQYSTPTSTIGNCCSSPCLPPPRCCCRCCCWWWWWSWGWWPCTHGFHYYGVLLSEVTYQRCDRWPIKGGARLHFVYYRVDCDSFVPPGLLFTLYLLVASTRVDNKISYNPQSAIARSIFIIWVWRLEVLTQVVLVNFVVLLFTREIQQFY